MTSTPCAFFTLLILCLGTASAQQTVECKSPLTEDQLVSLVKGKVTEVRIRQYVSACGIAFTFTQEMEQRLQTAGVPSAVLMDLSAKASSSSEEDPALKLKVELAFWEYVKQSGKRTFYEEYLKRYPNGQFAIFAKDKLGELDAAEKKGAEFRQDPRPAEDLSLNMEFVHIQPGSFMMGKLTSGESSGKKKNAKSAAERQRPAPNETFIDFAGNRELPHAVRITRPFEIGKFEVMQAQWDTVMGGKPTSPRGDMPVESSWEKAQEFLGRLNTMQSRYTYRLPTEAEWEYCARAGSTSDYYGNLDDIAWHKGNSSNSAHPVGRKQPNAWGLHDMIGNMGEWCNDWYAADYYWDSPAEDPPGPQLGRSRVLRGASYFDALQLLFRVSYRGALPPNFPAGNVGFRVVREMRNP